MVKGLRNSGHEVYDFRNPPNGAGFGWEEIHKDWIEWTAEQYTQALNHPRAIEGYNSDMDAMIWADVCVLLLPSGRSAHLEAGWMKGNGKKLIIITNDGEEPELMAKMADDIVWTFPDLLQALQ